MERRKKTNSAFAENDNLKKLEQTRKGFSIFDNIYIIWTILSAFVYAFNVWIKIELKGFTPQNIILSVFVGLLFLAMILCFVVANVKSLRAKKVFRSYKKFLRIGKDFTRVVVLSLTIVLLFDAIRTDKKSILMICFYSISLSFALTQLTLAIISQVIKSKLKKRLDKSKSKFDLLKNYFPYIYNGEKNANLLENAKKILAQTDKNEDLLENAKKILLPNEKIEQLGDKIAEHNEKTPPQNIEIIIDSPTDKRAIDGDRKSNCNHKADGDRKSNCNHKADGDKRKGFQTADKATIDDGKTDGDVVDINDIFVETADESAQNDKVNTRKELFENIVEKIVFRKK
ncbi:MAG: hypothetical protein RSD04_02730 [Clostridia bacterium]